MGVQRSKRTSFILYFSQREMVRLLAGKEKAALLDAIYDYAVLGEAPRLSGCAAIAFESIRAQLDIDREKYELTCEANRAAAKKRWEEAEEKEETYAKDGGFDRKTEKTTEKKQKSKGRKSEQDASACEGMPYDTDADADSEADGETETETGDDASADVYADRDADSLAAFLAAYPRRVREREAGRIWKREIAPHPGRAKAVMAALRLAIREDYRFGEIEYTPFPATFLSEAPWDAAWRPIAIAPQKRREPIKSEEELRRDREYNEFFQAKLEKTYAKKKDAESPPGGIPSETRESIAQKGGD